MIARALGRIAQLAQLVNRGIVDVDRRIGDRQRRIFGIGDVVEGKGNAFGALVGSAEVAVYVEGRARIGPVVIDREIAEARFFELDALPADLAYGHQRRLDEILNALPPSSAW